MTCLLLSERGVNRMASIAAWRSSSFVVSVSAVSWLVVCSSVDRSISDGKV